MCYILQGQLTEDEKRRWIASANAMSDDAIRAKEDAAASTLAGHSRRSVSTEARFADPRCGCLRHSRGRLDAFLHRPRRTPPSPTLAASPRPSRRRVAGGLRAGDARDGGDGAGAARGSAGRPKAKLDAGRVDTVFRAGDCVLLRTTGPLNDADMGKLRPRWDGPSTVLSRPSPDAYTLSLSRRYALQPYRWPPQTLL